MTEPKPAFHILHSIGAIAAGAIVNVALSLITDALLEKAGILPEVGHPGGSGPLLLATIYRTIYGVLGAYIAARLAPSRTMLHAMVLGFIGFALSILGFCLLYTSPSPRDGLLSR